MKTLLDLEDKLEKSIEDKEARDSGWKDNAELTAYLTRDKSQSKGVWKDLLSKLKRKIRLIET